MKTYTFFLKDGSIHEVLAEDQNAAFRLLCDKLCRSWASLYNELLDCLSPK